MTEEQLKAKRVKDAARKRELRAAAKKSTEAEAPKAEAPKAEAPKLSEVERVAKLVSLATLSAKKPATALKTDRPIHQAFIAAGFTYVKTQTVNGLVAHGYAHVDGRAALYTHAQDGADEAWAVKTALGEFGGTDKPTEESLKPVTAVQLKAAKVAANKKAASIERGKMLLETDRRRAEKHAEVLAAAKVVPPAIAGTPANVVRAVEMLSGLTAKQFDLDMLRGDKHYGHRLALLKRLFDREKVLVAETGINNLIEAFFSAVGTGEGCKAAKAACFATRCSEIAAASRTARLAVAKAEKLIIKQSLRRTYLDRVVPGTITPFVKPLSKARQHEYDKEELIQLRAELMVSPEQLAVPRPDADFDLVPSDVRLLRNPGNGIVMLQLEKANSQGAIVVYNNGVKVAAGVVAPETLKSLRPVASEISLVEVAKQLLNPIAPSVPVTPVAARHLTAVIEHCKETNMSATATVTPVASSKKFVAPKATKKAVVVKAAKAEPKKAPAKAEPKKTPTKKATKTEATERKSSFFRLRNDSKTAWSAFKTQKAEVVAALVKLGAVGAKAVGATRAQLLAAMPNVPEKNVSYYLSVWQKTEPAIIEKIAAE